MLKAVSCPSARTCFAVGAAGGRALVERLSAGSWHIQDAPAPPDSALSGISCMHGACSAVGAIAENGPGGPLVERWNGVRWTIQRDGGLRSSAGELNAVSCSSRSWCVAVGDFYRARANQLDGIVASWDGRTWRVQRSRKWTKPFTSISCRSTKFCLAVGGTDSAASGIALLWHPQRWDLVNVHWPAALSGISCVSSSECTTVGSALEDCLDCSSYSLVGRWNGAGWSVHNAPEPPAASQPDSFFDSELNGVDCIGPAYCMAVGDFDGEALSERWNGRRWRVVHTPPAVRRRGEFQGVSCLLVNRCIAVGFSKGPDGLASDPLVAMYS